MSIVESVKTALGFSTEPFSDGIASLPNEPSKEETADVKRWFERIESARKFDESARKQYAIDRRYARGDSGKFEVDVPIAGAYIDILKSYLYARDPDLDCPPADATNPPPRQDVEALARAEIEADPEAQAMMKEVGAAAYEQAVLSSAQAMAGGPQQAEEPSKTPVLPPAPLDPKAVAEQAGAAWLEEQVKAKTDALLKPYHQRRAEAKQFGQTLELVVAKLWKQARLKCQAKPMVGSGLTIAVGWIKATWQERMGEDPVVRQQISDLQDNLQRIVALQQELAEGEGTEQDTQRADLEAQIKALEAKVEVVVARGLAVDFVRGEDIQVAPGVPLTSYRDAPWISHRSFMAMADAKAAFPDIAEKLKHAHLFYEQKPEDPSEVREVGALADVSAKDADSYRSGSSLGDADSGSVLIWEVWDRQANRVLTLVEGVEGYARAPYAPTATRRFYPFFQYAPIEVDGERHPQSLVKRSYKLLDEYNRSRSNFAECRRRSIPKTGFDATNLSETEAAKIAGGGTSEMIPLKPQIPNTPIGNLVQPIAYTRVDMGLYDTAPIRAELEMIWGIQEALSSSIHVAKTATESEIQESGTQSRFSYMRDALDETMQDLAEYSAELALQHVSTEDARAIAGPWAFWPEGLTVDDLDALVLVNIRAGSSGKPDTSAERQSWAATLPIVQQSIMTIGQLRGSTPADIADCMEEVMAVTLERSGDRIDPERFIPSAPTSQPAARPPMQLPQPNPQPGAQ